MCEHVFDSRFLTSGAISDHSACCGGGTSATHNTQNAELNFRENRMWALVIGMWHCLLLPTVRLSAFYFGTQLNGFFCFSQNLKMRFAELLSLGSVTALQKGPTASFTHAMRKDWTAGWTNGQLGEFRHFMRNLDVHRRLNLLRWPSLLFNELEMGLNNWLLYHFCFSASLFSLFPHANLSPSATAHRSHMWATQQPILLQHSDTFEWLALIDHKRFFGLFFFLNLISVFSSGTKKEPVWQTDVCVFPYE